MIRASVPIAIIFEDLLEENRLLKYKINEQEGEILELRDNIRWLKYQVSNLKQEVIY